MQGHANAMQPRACQGIARRCTAAQSARLMAAFEQALEQRDEATDRRFEQVERDVDVLNEASPPPTTAARQPPLPRPLST